MRRDDANSAEADALPPHEILGPIGPPPFRDAYRARESATGRDVVLTVLRVEMLAPEAPELFLREVRAAAVLRHPHLVPILAAGLHDGRPAYITPWMAGGSLAERAARYAAPPAAAGLVERLARAAAAAHTHGQLHGGLNPQEISFDENDQPRVGGFGLLPCLLSTLREDEGIPRPNPAYLAPEQWTSRPAVEAATDVWALGAILYELLAGRPAFGDPADAVGRQIVSADPVPPHHLRPHLDPVLEAIVLHCLEKRPAERYPSARALADDLERWRLRRPTAVRPPTWTERVLRALRRKSR